MSEKFKKELIEWIKVIATALVFAFIITQFIRPTLVRGESMYPTLVENDYLIINRMAYKIGEPKDGDIINLYIKSENPDIKPIRQDFRIITCVKLDSHGDANGDTGTYSLYSVLHVDFNNTDDEYYADSTSAEALMEISKVMKLGYATNDTKQDDSQDKIQ